MLRDSDRCNLLTFNYCPGLLMSLADSSPRVMEVVGPRGLLHFLASMRFYAFRFVWCTPLYALYSTSYGRNTLGLKVAEVPSFGTEPQKEATPVFKDDNITVFAIPIASTPHCEVEAVAEPETLPDMPENLLKRKREDFQELPSKRPLLDSAVPVADGPTISSTSPPPLTSRYLDDPQFDSSTLEEDEADSWRRLIIEHMFTWVEPPPKPPKPMNKKGKKGQDPEHTEIPPPQVEGSLASLPQVPHWAEDAMKSQGMPPRCGPKGASLAGSLKRLPTFTAPVRSPSTAYIVVGPRVRGKFDAKRAQELGLYGPLRGKVARGETVSFTVDDGAGGEVQRTVKPEDCMGEHETTKVRLPPITCLMY